MTINLTVNDEAHTLDVDPRTPLLWVLRDMLGLTGTKFGCGAGLCGSCTVHLDGKAIRSCLLAVSEAEGRGVTTIEGLSTGGGQAVQQAWVTERVSQCGYCQPGQIMTAAALLAQKPRPTEDEIAATMSEVLCRCGAYQRIARAIHRAIEEG